jgi:hypothetical protein
VDRAGRAEASITRLARELLDRRVELLRGRDPVGEADPLGLLGPDQLPGHDQLLGPPEADDLRQPGRAAHIGDQPDPRLGQPDDRVRREHAEVARERELQRAADARALDLADHRLGHLLGEIPCLQAGAAERPQPLRRRRERGERGEIHARGEHGAVAADDDAADVRVLGGGPQRGARRDHQLVVERVALLRPVEDDVTDRTAIL